MGSGGTALTACPHTTPASTPPRLLDHGPTRALIPPLLRTLDAVALAFQEAARGTMLRPDAHSIHNARRAVLDAGLNLTCVHLWLTDNASRQGEDAQTPWARLLLMTEEEGARGIEQAVAYVSSLAAAAAARGAAAPSVYVAADDERAYVDVSARLRLAGGAIVGRTSAEPSALVDLFTLAECERVVQAAKYSTFSLAAALMRRRELVSVLRTCVGIGLTHSRTRLFNRHDVHLPFSLFYFFTFSFISFITSRDDATRTLLQVNFWPSDASLLAIWAPYLRLTTMNSDGG